MFPLQPGNVIRFSSSSPHQQRPKISEDMIPEDYDSLPVTDSDKILGNDRPKKLLYGSVMKNGDFSQHSKKKMAHRETERQRRQEMSSLYAALRSLLPFEFIKGKRSISDHMNEAVNYINHLQKSITELSSKRDELKKFRNPNTVDPASCESSFNSFSVHESKGMLGIEINSSNFREERTLPLSRFLELLIEEEGLDVVSCLSSQVNGKLLHGVQCVVNSPHSVDLAELRRKLADIIPSFRCSD